MPVWRYELSTGRRRALRNAPKMNERDSRHHLRREIVACEGDWNIEYKITSRHRRALEICRVTEIAREINFKVKLDKN